MLQVRPPDWGKRQQPIKTQRVYTAWNLGQKPESLVVNRKNQTNTSIVTKQNNTFDYDLKCATLVIDKIYKTVHEGGNLLLFYVWRKSTLFVLLFNRSHICLIQFT